MSLNGQPFEIDAVPIGEVAEALRNTRTFAATDPATIGLGRVERIRASAGVVLLQPGDPWEHYWLVLEGEIHALRPEADGSRTQVGMARQGDGYGEAAILTGKPRSLFFIESARDSLLVRLSAEDFWTLMACCPEARKVVLADAAQRFQSYQVEQLHREKLVSLGTLAAGLMHELHNPGTAAKRSATLLRGNLMRLQELSLRSSSKPKTMAQMECMHSLLTHAMGGCHAPALSSVEQSDAEEEMSQWLQAAGVENAFTIGPALVAIGFDQHQLDCAREAFDGGSFSDALNWLEALVSSVSLVCAIEESISRVSDLVMAVKKFAYDDRSAARELDVHDSLQSTLTILGHKLRIKNIAVEKCFAASPATIHTRGSALSQVWTNLIDNAVDASPHHAKIEIATWTEPPAEPGGVGCLAVGIRDFGAGIAPDVLPHIFEAFFTTKPQGHGTGLGLEIVHRIVTQKFAGKIDVDSGPGGTRFVVRLPQKAATA